MKLPNLLRTSHLEKWLYFLVLVSISSELVIPNQSSYWIIVHYYSLAIPSFVILYHMTLYDMSYLFNTMAADVNYGDLPNFLPQLFWPKILFSAPLHLQFWCFIAVLLTITNNLTKIYLRVDFSDQSCAFWSSRSRDSKKHVEFGPTRTS